MTTKELKQESGHSAPDKRYEFDRAMADLQQRLLIAKIAESYDPFSFIWGRLDRWLVAEIQRSRKFTQQEGRQIVVAKYLSRVVAATVAKTASLFGWQPQQVTDTFEELQQQSIITDKCEIKETNGRWFIHTDYC